VGGGSLGGVGWWGSGWLSGWVCGVGLGGAALRCEGGRVWTMFCGGAMGFVSFSFGVGGRAYGFFLAG